MDLGKNGYLIKFGPWMMMKGRCGIYQNGMESDKIVTYLEGIREECWMQNVPYVCRGFGRSMKT
jgi:hypothetical protein